MTTWRRWIEVAPRRMLQFMSFRSPQDAVATAQMGRRHSPHVRIFRLGRILWWWE